MKKMTTLFEIEYTEKGKKGKIKNTVRPGNKWVYDQDVIPTQKFDGSAVMIKNNILYKRYDCKINLETGQYKKPIPENAISCQEADKVTGHHPHWIPCKRKNPADKYHFDAFDKKDCWTDGTYELCGPKINGNKEKLEEHILIKHGNTILDLQDFSFDSIKLFLSNTENDIEGIVFYGSEGKMCKIRKADFGIIR